MGIGTPSPGRENVLRWRGGSNRARNSVLPSWYPRTPLWSQSSFAPDLRLFVGNLPFHTDSSSLAELFQQAGNVQMVIYDKITGRSRGFGFVTMSSMEEMEAAAQQFNGYLSYLILCLEFEGRSLRVNFGPQPPWREEPYSRGGGAMGGGSFSDSNQLYTLFNEQGRVLEARVVLTGIVVDQRGLVL